MPCNVIQYDNRIVFSLDELDALEQAHDLEEAEDLDDAQDPLGAAHGHPPVARVALLRTKLPQI